MTRARLKALSALVGRPKRYGWLCTFSYFLAGTAASCWMSVFLPSILIRVGHGAYAQQGRPHRYGPKNPSDERFEPRAFIAAPPRLRPWWMLVSCGTLGDGGRGRNQEHVEYPPAPEVLPLNSLAKIHFSPDDSP